jgi:anti-sigma factor RsiW
VAVADSKPDPDDVDPRDGATEDLVAYLDGELDAKAAEAVATRLSLDPTLRAEADALQRAWEVLDVLPRPQPSAAFATRTVSQVIPIPTGMSGTQLLAPTMPAISSHRSHFGFWLASTVVILVAGVGGFLGHRVLSPAVKPTAADPSLEDVPMMKNLRLYRNVDDMEYLKKLDSPELFGDEGE